MSAQASSRFPQLTVWLPAWVDEFLPDPDTVFPSVEDRMQLAIDLARTNVEQGTGGPFGAAIFDMDSHKLIAPGVNVVVPSCWSGGHGEMVAYAIAQQVLQNHDLGGPGMPRLELITSTEPCSMCFGATPWSGIRRLVCGARDADARAIGFDEGPKLDDWVQALESRGIEVVQDILREQASRVLQDYAANNGVIYNGRND